MRISDWSSDVCSSDLVARLRPSTIACAHAGAGLLGVWPAFCAEALVEASVEAGGAGFFKCFGEAFTETIFLHTGQVRKFGNPGVPLAVAVVDGRKLDARVIGVPSGERFHDRPDADEIGKASCREREVPYV